MAIRNALLKFKYLACSKVLIGLALSLFWFATQQAQAEVIDRIDVNQVGDEAEIQIHFISRINYRRQEVLKNGDIRIYLTLLNIDSTDPRLNWERKDSPPSDIVPPFTVTFPELDSSLTLSFGTIVKYRVLSGHDGRSISIFTPANKLQKKEEAKISRVPPIAGVPAIAPARVAGSSVKSASAPTDKSEPSVTPTDLPPVVPQTPENIRLEAEQLYIVASDLLQSNQFDQSIGALTQLLKLPPNVLTQSAQKLMNEAYEKKHAQKATQERLQVIGGISQNFYKGVTNKDTFTTDGVNQPAISRFTGTDRSQLISSLDLTAQKRTEILDTRLVLREQNTVNFLPGMPNEYHWNAVYIEQIARDNKYMYRLGRQAGVSGGVHSLFDGVNAGYSLNETWRVSATVGAPVEFISNGILLGDQKIFTSMNIDLTRLPNEWGGSAYVFRQHVGGINKVGSILDRSSLGLEAHLYDAKSNYMTQLEYDTLYRKINLASFQGNWNQDSGANYFVLIDHRRSSPLAFNMQGQFSQSVKEVLNSGLVSIKTLRDNAIALNPIINMVSIGMSHPYSPRLRLATDFRVINISGIGGTTITNPVLMTQPGSPGSGNQYAYSLQAIGNNLLFENDLGIANATWTRSDTAVGQSFSFSQVQPFRQRWRLDEALQLFNQSNVDGTHQTQVRLSLTLNFRMNDSMSFLADGGLEKLDISSIHSENKSLRRYYSLGYRWDFR